MVQAELIERGLLAVKLVELLKLVDEGYPDGVIAEHFDPETGEVLKGRGDTLAEFVVIEIGETFDEDATDEVQLEEARRCLRMAVDDLQQTMAVLLEKLIEVRQKVG